MKINVNAKKKPITMWIGFYILKAKHLLHLMLLHVVGIIAL